MEARVSLFTLVLAVGVVAEVLIAAAGIAAYVPARSAAAVNRWKCCAPTERT